MDCKRQVARSVMLTMHDMAQSLHLSNRLCARDRTFAVRQ